MKKKINIFIILLISFAFQACSNKQINRDKVEGLNQKILEYKNGDKEKALEIAQAYEYMKQFDNSIKWSKIALSDGDIAGASNLGSIYKRKFRNNRYKHEQKCKKLKDIHFFGCDEYNYKNDINYLKAQEWLQYTYLNKKSSHSLYNVALFYFTNDNEKALHWFKKLYSEDKSGYWKDDAARYLAMLYTELKEYDLAIAWYEKSAELGNLNATSELSHLYKERKEYERYIYWQEKEFMRNRDEESALDLAQTYKNNLKDYEKALEWYKKAYYTESEVSVIAINYTPPTNEELKSNIAKEIAKLYENQLNDISKAKEWYKKTIN